MTDMDTLTVENLARALRETSEIAAREIGRETWTDHPIDDDVKRNAYRRMAELLLDRILR